MVFCNDNSFVCQFLFYKEASHIIIELNKFIVIFGRKDIRVIFSSAIIEFIYPIKYILKQAINWTKILVDIIKYILPYVIR